MSLALVEFSIYSKSVQKIILFLILRKLTLFGMNHTAYPGLTVAHVRTGQVSKAYRSQTCFLSLFITFRTLEILLSKNL